MKIIVIALGLLLAGQPSFSQEPPDSIVMRTLNYLNNWLYLNFDKAEELILVKYRGDYYIVDKYGKPNGNIQRTRIFLDLRKELGNKYYFSLEWSSIIRGNFELTIENGNYRFRNLNYIKLNY